MELTRAQIEALYRFTEKKSVRWYDLQIELVDHLASRIEEEMDADPQLEFDAALDKVYRGFGIFGFARLVQEKQHQLQHQARRLWWKEILCYLRWPKIALLALMLSAFWYLSNLVDLYILISIYIVGYLVAGGWMLYQLKKTSKMKKQLLMLQYGPVHISGLVIVFEFGMLSSLYESGAVVFSLAAVLGILIKLAGIRLYRNVKAEAEAMYPEAFA